MPEQQQPSPDTTAAPATSPDDAERQQVLKLYNERWNTERKLTLRQIEDERSKDRSALDYVADVPRGIGEGLFKAGNSVAQLVGQSNVSNDDILSMNRTWVGSLTSNATEFGVGMAATAPLGGIGAIAKLGKFGKLAYNVIRGAAVDAAFFDGSDGHLSDLIDRFPVLSNPVTRYLESKPGDQWAEKRFKNAVEGLGLGAVMETLFHGVKVFRSRKVLDAATKAGDLSLAAKVEKDLAESTGKLDESLAPSIGEMEAGEAANRLSRFQSQLIDEEAAAAKAEAHTAENARATMEDGDISRRLDAADAAASDTPVKPVVENRIDGATVRDRVLQALNLDNDGEMLKHLTEQSPHQTDLNALREDFLDGTTFTAQQVKHLLGSDDDIRILTQSGALREESDGLWKISLRDIPEGDIAVKPGATPSASTGGAQHEYDFKGAMSNLGITDSFIDSMWSKVEKGESIPRMGALENALRDAQKAGTLTSREDVANIVNGVKAPAAQAEKTVTQSASLPTSSYEVKPEPAVVAKRTITVKDGILSAPPELEAEIKQQIKARIESGMPLDEALVDAVRSHINYERLDIPDKPAAVLKFVQSMADDWLTKRVGGPEALAVTEKLAREDLASRGADAAFIDKVVNNAEFMRQENLHRQLVEARMMRNLMADDIADLAAKAEGGSGQALVDLNNRIHDFLRLHYATQVIQIQGARIPSAGRVIAGYAPVNVDKMAAAIRQTMNGGTVDATRLKTALQMVRDDPQALANVVKPFEAAGTSFLKRALNIHNEIWMNGLLSGLKTQTANFTSNVLHTFALPLDKLVGGAIKLDMSEVRSGYRMLQALTTQTLDVLSFTRLSRELAPDGASAYKAAGRSWWESTGILDHVPKAEGTPQGAVSALNMGLDPNSMIGAAVDWTGRNVVRQPGRLLNASDEFFKQINYRAYMRDAGYKEAVAQGITDPKKVSQFVEDYVRNGFDSTGRATNEAALAYAQKATFTNPLADGSLIKSLEQLSQRHPTVRLVFPFIRTPYNIMKAFAEYTPGLNLLQKEYRTRFLRGDADAIGRMAVGSLFGLTATLAVASGKVTGYGPTNRAEREVWLAAGNQPYSFVFTNDDGSKEYVSYRRIDPFASTLGLIADFADAHAHMSDEQGHAVASAIAMGIGQNITSKTYFRSLVDVADFFSNDDQRMSRFVKARVASYVPSLSRDAANDDYIRETRSVLDAIKARLPGFSDDLAPRRNFLGEMTPVPAGWTPFGEGDVSRQLSPFAMTRRLNGDAKSALADLRTGFDRPSKNLGPLDLTMFSKDRDGRQQDAYDRWLELHDSPDNKIAGRTLSESLQKLVTSDWYKNHDQPVVNANDLNDPRVVAVKALVEKYRAKARDVMIREYPEIQQQKAALDREKRMRQNPTVQKILAF